ncbi:MAG: hypothetical protein V1702_04850 [Candidatus Woesearchaeota archaeon]
MRITIDTKEDKPEDIKKAIELLNQVLGTEAKVAAAPEGIFDIFGNNPSPAQPAQPSQPSQQADIFQAPQPELQKEDFNVGNYIETPPSEEEEKAKKEIKPYF